MKGNTVPSLASRVTDTFKQAFTGATGELLIVRSPGRVNLIGEHTDYNNGFVLPAAIDKSICMAVSRRADDEVHIVSLDLRQTYTGSVRHVAPSGMHWPDYILGVVEQLQSMGCETGGVNLAFGGDIPPGAGLSSSAALECATAFAMNELFGLALDPLTMVKLSQAAENEFVGVKCGIMDQFASMFGKKDHVIRLDCQTLAYSYFPFRLDGIRIVLLDTRVKHSLASSQYNIRRQQCESGVRMVQKRHPSVRTLRDVTGEMLRETVAPVDELIWRRCSYVVEENERLQAATEDLERGDLVSFGQRMFGSHEGLSHKYEVSCPELDFLVDQVREEPGVIGARMMGGGFGGCTINLVREDAIEDLAGRLTRMYRTAMNKELKVYIGQIENGTSIV
ncbi:MAG TPA: galactokinase [Puia sp.]|nr:galactokinase [Puia sp.]